MPSQRVRRRRQITLGVLLTILAAATSFVSDLNAHIKGNNEQLTQMVRMMWIILILLSILAWIRAFRSTSGLGPLLIISCGSASLCFYSYLGVGFASDVFIGVPEPDYVNEYVLKLAIYGAATTIFFVLFIASLITLLYRGWSAISQSPRPDNTIT